MRHGTATEGGRHKTETRWAWQAMVGKRLIQGLQNSAEKITNLGVGGIGRLCGELQQEIELY